MWCDAKEMKIYEMKRKYNCRNFLPFSGLLQRGLQKSTRNSTGKHNPNLAKFIHGSSCGNTSSRKRRRKLVPCYAELARKQKLLPTRTGEGKKLLNLSFLWILTLPNLILMICYTSTAALVAYYDPVPDKNRSTQILFFGLYFWFFFWVSCRVTPWLTSRAADLLWIKLESIEGQARCGLYQKKTTKNTEEASSLICLFS